MRLIILSLFNLLNPCLFQSNFRYQHMFFVNSFFPVSHIFLLQLKHPMLLLCFINMYLIFVYITRHDSFSHHSMCGFICSFLGYWFLFSVSFLFSRCVHFFVSVQITLKSKDYGNRYYKFDMKRQEIYTGGD